MPELFLQKHAPIISASRLRFKFVAPAQIYVCKKNASPSFFTPSLIPFLMILPFVFPRPSVSPAAPPPASHKPPPEWQFAAIAPSPSYAPPSLGSPQTSKDMPLCHFSFLWRQSKSRFPVYESHESIPFSASFPRSQYTCAAVACVLLSIVFTCL